MSPLTLHNLKLAEGSKKKKRRVGRGNASGKGNYSGRGMKGQRSRSGGKNKSALRGIKSYLLRIPKSKGFKSKYPAKESVNLRDLEKIFEDGSAIYPKDLHAKGLVKTTTNGIKILGTGKLSKKFEVSANAFSKTANDAIIKAGGKVILIAKPKKEIKK